MKILHGVLTKDFYGSEHYCSQLARLQMQAGDDVVVLVKGGSAEPLKRFRSIVGPSRVIVTPAWSPPFLDRFFLGRAIRKVRPDVVHTHLGRATRLMGRIARRLGILHLASLHLRYNEATYGGCDGIVCVAAWQRATIRDFAGVVGVVRNWVPELRSQTTGAAMDTDVAAQSGGERVITLGSVGRLDPPKGYDLLVEAFRLAFPLEGIVDAQGANDRADGNREHPAPAVRLVIVGEGPERPRLERMAAGDRRIQLVGYQEDVRPWLEGFDAFVSSSRFEGLALVLLEAMTLGLPLLLAGIPGNVELADLQKTGRDLGRGGAAIPVVEPEDVQALAGGLRALVAELARGPRARVVYDLTELNPETAAARMAACYEAAARVRRKKRTGARA